MKKFDWNHPVTRKDYAVLCGWSFGICMAIYAVGVGITYWDEIKTWTKTKVKGLRAKLLW